MKIRTPKWFLAGFAVVLVAAVGAGAYLLARSSSGSHPKATATATTGSADTDKRLRTWRARQGQDWATYKAQYQQGFYSACDDVFLLSGVQGSLLRDSGGREYTLDDCHAAFAYAFNSEQPPVSVPTDPMKAGQMNGGDSGCTAMVVKANTNLKGVTTGGKTLTLSLKYCGAHYHQYPGPFLNPHPGGAPGQ